MSDELIVKFWGVRGSHPAPGAATVKYGGNTACVEVRAGGRTIVLDAGTGIIPLGRELARRARAEGRPLETVVLLSHMHHDHIQGFPFFVPAYVPGTRLHIYGPGASVETLGQVLEVNQGPLTFPVSLGEMAASKDIRSLRETDMVVLDSAGVRVTGPGEPAAGDAVRVHIHRSYAHPGGTYIYRVEWHNRSLVYATDTEGYAGTDRRLAAFARGADLLIHDAQYSEAHYRGQAPGLPVTQGYGHSTPEMACELAGAAGAGTLVLFHHDPNSDDTAIAECETRARKLFPNSVAACEGLELAVGGSGLLSLPVDALAVV
jgi:phosphoribosyl 1,2-cyclic phosphodiesterase